MTLKFKAGQVVRITEEGPLAYMRGHVFEVTVAHPLADKHYGPNFYEGADVPMGVWERFLEAVPEGEKRAGMVVQRHGAYRISITDVLPIEEGKEHAADLRVRLLKNGQVVKEFSYPAYRIYTLLAHWTEGLDAEAAESR